jgi:hypothetical protein
MHILCTILTSMKTIGRKCTTYSISIYVVTYGKNKTWTHTGSHNDKDSHITPALSFHIYNTQYCTSNNEISFLHCWTDSLSLLVLATKRALLQLSRVQSTIQSCERASDWPLHTCAPRAATALRRNSLFCAWNTGISDSPVSCWRSGMGQYTGRS